MNRKQLLLLVILVAVAAGCAWFIYRGKIAAWENPQDGEGNILNFEPDAVGEVEITGTGGALTLTGKNGAWIVRQRDNYPADFDKVAALIRTAWELKPTQTVEAGPSQFARFDLTAPDAGGAGTLVNFKGAGGKPLASLMLGKKYMKKPAEADLEMGDMPLGRYVMAMDGKNRVLLVSQTLDEFAPKPERWLNHDFIKVGKIQAIAVSGTAPGDAWQAARDSVTSTWKLLGPKPNEQINLIKASPFAGLLANATFDDVLPANTKTDTGLDKPVTVDLVTFDHFSYRLKIGKQIGSDYAVKIEVNTPGGNGGAGEKQAAEKLAGEKKFEGHIYLVDKLSLDPLLQGRAQITMPVATPSPTPMLAAPGTLTFPPATSRGTPAPPRPSVPPGVTVVTPPVSAPTSTPAGSPVKKK